MLTISNLSIHFAGKYLYDNISFAVKPKDRIGLIGKNGTGKSTMLKIIAGLQSAEQGQVATPNGYKIGYLPQEGGSNSEKTLYEEASAAMTDIRVLEDRIAQITEELTIRTDYESEEYSRLIEEMTEANERFHILGGGATAQDIDLILTGLGFTMADFEMPVNTFSGGWQMRLELAKILLQQPDIILLDEPTNHLDIESIIWLESFLKNFPGSIIIVSHDKRFLDNITNRTIEIVKGKIYDLNYPYSLFVENRKDQIAIQQAAKKNQDKAIAHQERFIERFKSKANFASRAQSKLKLLDKIERIEIDDEDSSQIKFRFPEAPRSGRLIAEVTHLTKKYDDKVVLNDIHFAIERGEKVAFVGKNGEGKSTLSKIFAGIESYDGNKEIGHNVQIGYFAQQQAHILPEDMTAFEVIDQAAKDEMRARVRSLLGAFLFSGDDVYKKVKVLSGGEKGRLALAKLLLEPINFLIMDEPTNHLDMSSKEVLKQALLEYQGGLLIVSHDRDFLQGLTQKTVYFKGGKIKEYLGTVDEFISEYEVEHLDDLSMNNNKNTLKQPKAAAKEEAPSSSNNTQRDANKNLQKEKSRLEKAIKDCEIAIVELEEKIADFEKKFEDPEVFNNPNKMKDLQKLYDSAKSQLDEKYQQFDKHSEELDVLLINE